MRAHKLALKALWRLLMPALLTFVAQSDKECHDDNLRSHIAAETHTMYHLSSSNMDLHNEGTPARQKRDNDDEDALVSTFKRFIVLSDVVQFGSLQNVATKDIATDAIRRAKHLGQQQVDTFVQDRLVARKPDRKPKVSIHQSMPRNNASTFSSLYDVVKDSKEKDKKTILKADRTVL